MESLASPTARWAAGSRRGRPPQIGDPWSEAKLQEIRDNLRTPEFLQDPLTFDVESDIPKFATYIWHDPFESFIITSYGLLFPESGCQGFF